MTASDDALAQLDDYLSGALSDVHAGDYEEALFAAAAAGSAPELAHLDALYQQVAWFAARGGFMAGTTAEVINHLRTLPRVHYLDIGADTHTVEWPADTELVVYRVDVDLRGYENIDVEILNAQGEHMKWFRDCIFDPADGALYGVCDAPLARSTFRIEPVVARVQAIRANGTSGKREIVAELRVTPH